MDQSLNQIATELKTLNKTMEKISSTLEKIHGTMKDENSVTSKHTLKSKLVDALTDLGNKLKPKGKHWE